MTPPDFHDPELGLCRRCATCREVLPLDAEFFQFRAGRALRRSCLACAADRRHGRAIPLRSETHGRTRNVEAKRLRDLQRKADLRADPVFGDIMRQRQLATQKRYYVRHRAVCLERSRAAYAARLDRPVMVGLGRPRVAA